MVKNTPVSSSTVVALTALIVVAGGCQGPVAETPVHADTPPKTQATRVVATKPVRATLERKVEEPGQILAYETTAIHAKLTGYLRNFTVDIGSPMKKGQVLAEVWVPELEAELEEKRSMVEQAKADQVQAEAAVEVAQASLASAQAKLVEAQAGTKRAEAEVARWQSEANRIRQLVHDSAITGSYYDETKSKLQAAEATRDEVAAQIKSAEAAVKQAAAELDKARADVKAAASRVAVAQHAAERTLALWRYTRIEAPYDGLVIERHFDTGHLTQPGATTEPLFVVSRSDLVTITVDVPEMASIAVEPGDRVVIRVQAIEGRNFEGTVTRTSWALDPKTRTLRTEIDLPNPERVLRPGLYAYATIIAEQHRDVLAVPTTAIVKDGPKRFCVVVADGKAVRKQVQTGIDDGTLTEIKSGLEPGEVVVKAYADALTEGQPLEVAQMEDATPKASKP